MRAWLRWSLFTLFFLTFAFAGGGAFLLFAMVPLEKWLVGAQWQQGEMDRFLSFFVFGWFGIAGVVALTYYRVTLSPKYRKIAALTTLAVSTLAAVGMFYVFMNTGLSIIASRAGKVEQMAGGRLTFGPYPDEDLMRRLKAEGFDGIIALLNRTVPFEGPLLDQEIENAKLVGIQVHVLPMLPWVTDNRASLEEARQLLADGEKRYYVHCYLGRHRTNLIRTLAMEMNAAPQQKLSLRPMLERGPIFVYEDGRILVGPYPTDEEWIGKILNYGVREVVSVVNRDNPSNLPWIAKLKTIGEQYGITVVEKPLDSTFPDEQAIQDVARYAKAREHKVFVVGFRNGNWTWALDTALGGGGTRTREALTRDKLERGPLLKAGNLVFGPLPTDEELALLRRAGVKEFVSIIDASDPKNQPWIEKEQKWAKLYGFKLTHMSIPRKSYSATEIQAVSDYLQTLNEPAYVHGFSADVRLEVLYRLAQRYPHVIAANEAAAAAAAAAPPPAAAPPKDQPQKR